MNRYVINKKKKKNSKIWINSIKLKIGVEKLLVKIIIYLTRSVVKNNKKIVKFEKNRGGKIFYWKNIIYFEKAKY